MKQVYVSFMLLRTIPDTVITTSIFTCTKHNLYTKDYVKHFVLISSSQPSCKLGRVISSSTEEEVEHRDVRVKWRKLNSAELFTFWVFRKDTRISHLIEKVRVCGYV